MWEKKRNVSVYLPVDESASRQLAQRDILQQFEQKYRNNLLVSPYLQRIIAPANASRLISPETTTAEVYLTKKKDICIWRRGEIVRKRNAFYHCWIGAKRKCLQLTPMKNFFLYTCVVQTFIHDDLRRIRSDFPIFK